MDMESLCYVHNSASQRGHGLAKPRTGAKRGEVNKILVKNVKRKNKCWQYCFHMNQFRKANQKEFEHNAESGGHLAIPFRSSSIITKQMPKPDDDDDDIQNVQKNCVIINNQSNAEMPK